MLRYVSLLIAILIADQVRYSSGYYWVKSNTTSTLPSGTISVGNNFVGRARHFQMILPADIPKMVNSKAVVRSCGKEWEKPEFEVLIATEPCQWKHFGTYEDLPSNIVLAGRMENNEPIYVAKLKNRNYNYDYDYNYDDNNHVLRLLLSSQKIYDTIRFYELSEVEVLVCEDLNTWLDASASQMPKNAIVGRTSAEGQSIYVGRILTNCNLIPASVEPEMGLAIGQTDSGELVKLRYCQVLVGPAGNYSWIKASDGEIPDGAVIGGKFLRSLKYVALVNETVGYIEFSTSLGLSYEVLVRRDEEKVTKNIDSPVLKKMVFENNDSEFNNDEHTEFNNDEHTEFNNDEHTEFDNDEHTEFNNDEHTEFDNNEYSEDW